MNLDKLLIDATGLNEASSARQRHHALQQMLAEDGHSISAKGVGKWFERESLPATWLVNILKSAQRRGRRVDLKNYI
ncbi:hypothetical protein BSL82_15870 [Tardibacter chloracetimidivorans]|uniref:Uncharacterized protein n=1 Tax=Tardibacter chloracetimidivorans TaxID=1921510 RepID=A0A1L3ZY68_9SPHN|nr:hypothetical protein [Tardibacter chloracetimidivorans]API60583.1 hypothetical protein BSL82_15870 [Tardibacter chloracetimidivorans]